MFTEGEDSFGTYQIVQLMKSVEDNRFFKASHMIVLKGGKQITNKEILLMYMRMRSIEFSETKNFARHLIRLIKSCKAMRSYVFSRKPFSNLLLIPLLLDYENSVERYCWDIYITI